MRKFLARLAVVATATVGLGVVASPAFATGGGCASYTDTKPCISTGRIGDYVYGDFYQYAQLDSSRYSYSLSIYTGRNNQPWVLKKSVAGRLDHYGHYSQIKVFIAALPAVPEHALTRVIIYNSAGAEHYRHDSPVVYYGT